MKKDGSIPKLQLRDIHEFVFERFRENKAMRDLVQFQSINKYLIMAHSPSHLNRLGGIVANHEGLAFSTVLENYHAELRGALKIKPTRKSHFNTLQHIAGHFSPDLSKSEKGYLQNMLGNYREGRAEINEVLQILKDCTAKYEKSYLSRQTYFLFFTPAQRLTDNL